MKLIIRMAAVMGIGVIVAVFVWRGKYANDVRIQYRSESKLTLREPVQIEVIINNNSTRSVTVDLGVNSFGQFRLDLDRPDGSTVVADPGDVRRLGHWTSGTVTLGPGEQHSTKARINKWLQFDQIGEYRLTAVFTGPVRNEGGDIIVERSATLPIEVLPWNRDRLDLRCSQLLNDIRFNSSPAVQLAAESLASIDDPIVVPYLNTAIAVKKGMGVDTLAIGALERIGTKEARESLELIADDSRGETAKLAREALSRLGAKTS